jgi:hypothetical protein
LHYKIESFMTVAKSIPIGIRQAVPDTAAPLIETNRGWPKERKMAPEIFHDALILLAGDGISFTAKAMR